MDKYFSPKTLLQIANYYQMSRLSYGLCVYLDWGNLMESLEKTRLKYFRSILGTKDNVSSNLLRVVLNLPKMEYLLYNRLLNVVCKYQYHFNQRPTIYDNILSAFQNRVQCTPTMNMVQRYSHIKFINIKMMAKYAKININQQFIPIMQKYYYKYPDRRDGLMIRYLCNYGFFDSRLFPTCKYCGQANSRDHITNDCQEQFFCDLRQSTLRDISQLTREESNNLMKSIIDLYFCPNPEWKPYRTLGIIKKFVAKLYIERPKQD